jgi:nicotinamide-nucleotide amidase
MRAGRPPSRSLSLRYRSLMPQAAAPRSAAIIAIGSEMLGPTRVDTNSLKTTRVLEEHAIPVVRKSVVGDILQDLVREIVFTAEAADILIISGGLGPTDDDLTREALAEAFGLAMEVDQSIIDKLEARFAARGWKMPETNRKQANVFIGQTTLSNERGTAPGFHITTGGKHVWVFPGVPHELEWMLATYFRPWLEEVSGKRSRHRRVLKIASVSESGVDEMLKPYYEKHAGELLTILAHNGHIELHVSGDGDEATALAFIAERENELREIFGTRIFGSDEDTLESVVGALLRERGETLATAESCTGGLLGSRITDVPGSSTYYLGGAVCYTAAAKIELAGVDPALIGEHGEVSEPVAFALARGARARFGSTWGIGITGIAGPGGGSEAKPVGTVHLAVVGPSSEKHRKILIQMPRTMVKWFSTQNALDVLRRMMLE